MGGPCYGGSGCSHLSSATYLSGCSICAEQRLKLYSVCIAM